MKQSMTNRNKFNLRFPLKVIERKFWSCGKEPNQCLHRNFVQTLKATKAITGGYIMKNLANVFTISIVRLPYKKDLPSLSGCINRFYFCASTKTLPQGTVFADINTVRFQTDFSERVMEVIRIL